MNEQRILDMLERENITLADMWLRTLAWVIDIFLLSFIFMLLQSQNLASLQDSAGRVDYALMRDFMMGYVWQICVFKIAYDTIFHWQYGATLGKMVCKIRVVSVDLLDNPSFFWALLRACGKYVGEGLLFITYFFGFGDVFSRTLHDRVAKTLVVSR